jgi:putative ABC transport system substrate-binding protein
VLLESRGLAPRGTELGRLPRVGLLWRADGPDVSPQLQHAFLDRLAEQGRIDGRTVVLEWRYAATNDGYAGLADELVRHPVDVVVAFQSTPAAEAAQRTTRTIPILAVAVTDPLGTGLVHNLARPGGNLTGLSSLSTELWGKRLELLRASVPELARVAFLSPRSAAADVQ